MAKFCGKCGTKLDEVTGLCPNCDADKRNRQTETPEEVENPKPKQDTDSEPKKSLSKKETKKKCRADKKDKQIQRKAAKKEKWEAMTVWQKVRRFFLKLLVKLFVLTILVASIVGTMMYLGKVDISIIFSILEKIGLENKNSVTVFENGDRVSTPGYEHIDYDAETNILYFNNQLIVYTFTDLKQEDAERLAELIGGEIVGDISGSINALQIQVDSSTLDELELMADKLMEYEEVLYAGYEYPMQLLPADVDSNPWSEDYNHPEVSRGNESDPSGNDWWAEVIGAYTAWNYSDKCQNIKVGILDDGFDSDHEDLKENITFLPNYTKNSEENHGTHVAGIIGAKNNAVGIRGIADSAEMVCVDWSPTGSISYLTTAEYIEIIKQMVDADVKIINNSWGNPFKSEYQFMLSLYWDEEGSFEKIDNRYILLRDRENKSIKYEFTGDSKDNVQFFINQNKVTYENFIKKVQSGYWIRLVTENSKVKEIYYINDGYIREQIAVKFTGAYDSYVDYCEVVSQRTGLECILMMAELMLNGKEDFLIVEAAGNSGVDAHYSGYFCAIEDEIYNNLSASAREKLAQKGINYNSIDERILIVGAVENKYDKKSYRMSQYSNFGGNVDICAPGGKGGDKPGDNPGENIFSTLTDNNYGELGGTSMAAPMVAGSAAFIWSLEPTLSAPEIRNILLTNTTSQAYGVGDRKVYSYPMLNIGAAAKAVMDHQIEQFDLPPGVVEFNGHYYYLYEKEDVTDWDTAQKYCETQGGYLATITSAEEDAFLYSYIINSGYHSAIFGLTDQEKVDNWCWVTGEEFSYQNWHTGEPNHQGGYEHYGMYYEKYTDGTWNDGDFGANTINGGIAFICEWGEYSVASNDISIQEPIRTTSDEREIVLVLDTSGSMSGTPMEETKEASAKFIETVLEEDAGIGIVTYDNSAKRAFDFSVSKGALESIITAIYEGGGTNIEAGLREAQGMLDEGNAKKKILVLMSDGEPNDGRVGEALIEFADEIKDEDIIIYTLGFFENLEGNKSSAQALMEAIASDGCHYEVASADDLVFFFEDIADQINGQKYIYIRIACPVDVTVTHNGEMLCSAEDDLNLRTDFGTLTFEENENVTDANEDDRIKVLRLKEGADYDVQIVGTGYGIMDYTIGFMDENGDYSDFRRFEDIKITRKTSIDTIATVSEESILNIDEDGDGKYDLKLRADENGYGEEVEEPILKYIIFSSGVLLALLTFILIVQKKRKNKKAKENS